MPPPESRPATGGFRGAAVAALWGALAAAPATDAAGQEQTARIPVVVSEGTNFSVAAAPDGTRFVLDLQGALWRLPAEGGEAEALTDGLGDDRLPDFHPDGDRVAFQSYRGGSWNIWSLPLTAADGEGQTEAERLTDTPFDDREPAWSPDGARLAFSSDRGGSYDIWVLDVATGQAAPATSAAGNEFHPAWTPDGAALVFVAASDAAPRDARIERLAWSAGEAAGPPVPVPGTDGNVSAPSVSPDGSRLAFRRIEDAGRTLMGTRFPAARSSDLVVVPFPGADGGEGSDSGAGPGTIPGAGEDVFPFRPKWLDGETLLYTADGGIRRYRLPSDGAEEAEEEGEPAPMAAAPEAVPFTAALAVRRAPPRRGRIRAGAEEPMPVLGIVRPSLSPDGTRLLYAALGDLWTAPLDGSEAPTPLTRDTYLDTDPVWLPDGESVVFASDRAGTMDIWEKRVGASPGAGLTQLTSRLGAETGPAVSPDGNRIAYLDENGSVRLAAREGTASGGPGRPRPPAGGGTTDETPLFSARRGAGMPEWTADGGHVAAFALVPFSTRYREGWNRVALVAADTGEARFLEGLGEGVGGRGSSGPAFSPDGSALAFSAHGGLYVQRLMGGMEADGPPERIFDRQADFPSWAPDGESLVAVSGTGVVRVRADGGGAEEIRLRHEFTAPRAAGELLVQNATVVDVEAGTTRPGMDILVEGARIVSIEPTGAEPPGEDVRVVRAGGAFVIPGLVEAHTHLAAPAYGNRLGRAHLAWGVTSIRVMAGPIRRVLEERESILAGLRVGPRMFVTGEPLDGGRVYYDGMEPVGSADDAVARARAGRELGYDLLKTYVRLDDAIQRDAIHAAQRAGLFVSSHEIYPALRFGVNGIEHVSGTSRRGFSPKLTDAGRSYGDVRDLLAASGAFHAPTMLIYGGWDLALAREPELVLDERRTNVLPAWVAEAAREAARQPRDAGAALAPMRNLWRNVAEAAEAGARIVAGTDTPIVPYGLGFILEVEQLSEAGLGPAAALRAATSTAAEALGLSEELGAVEAGRLADLVLLEADPLEDIRNLRRVKAVVLGGRLVTLDQLLAF